MKRRYKLLIGFLITAVILIFIFFITKDKKIYYLSLGDSLSVGQSPYNDINKSYGDYVASYLKEKNILEFYTKNFSNSNYRSIDLLNDLKENKEIIIDDKKISIKHALIKSDLVTVSVGANDLFYKLNIGNEFKGKDFTNIYTYVDEVILDIDKLLFELRKSCKEQIMVLGFYNPFINYSHDLATRVEPVILYANNKLEDLVNKYDMTYVGIHNSFLNNVDYLPDILEVHPTKKGYKAIANQVIKLIDKKTLAK